MMCLLPLEVGHCNNFSGFESRAAELQRLICLISESVPHTVGLVQQLAMVMKFINAFWASKPIR